jgi:hypothetical protein
MVWMERMRIVKQKTNRKYRCSEYLILVVLHCSKICIFLALYSYNPAVAVAVAEMKKCS